MKIKIMISIFSVILSFWSLVIELSGIEAEEKGLVGLWHFDEGKGDKVFDSSKNGNHGEIKGANWVEGISGHALSFNGKNAYVRIPTQGFDYSKVTIEMWVKTAKWDDSSRTLYNMYGGKSGISYIELNIYQNNLYWINQGLNEFVVTYDTSGVSKEKWHHLAATADFNSDSYKLFLDGVEVGSSTTASNVPIVPDAAYIGARYEKEVSDYFDGCVDEVVIYNHVLIPDEIKSHYIAKVPKGQLSHLLDDNSAVKEKEEQKSMGYLPDLKIQRDVSQKVVVHENHIDINLPNNVWVCILKNGDELSGIGNVAIDKLPLRNPDSPISISISSTKDSVIKYKSWRYKGYTIEGENILLQSSLIEEDGNEDSLYLIFEPKQFQVDDHIYKGFGYHYKFTSNLLPVYQLTETSSWELGGSGDGNTLIHQPYIYTEMKHEENFSKESTERFVHQPFDYQMNTKGSLISYYETVAMINSNISKKRNSSVIKYMDNIYFGSAKELETPTKYILFDYHRGIDEWTLVRDTLYDMYMARYGLKETEPMPMVHWESMSKSGGFDKLNPYDFATVLPKLRDIGIKYFLGDPFRLSRASLSGSGGDNDDRWIEGAEEGMKYVAKKARENGIEFFVWVPSNHLSNPEMASNSVLNLHPDWMTRTISGETTCWHFSKSLRVCSFKTGFKDFYLTQLKSFYEKTGLSGLWLDSNRMLWVPELFNYGVPNPGPELEEYLSVLRELHKIGFSTMIEMGGGSTPLGLSSGVYYLENLLGHEFLAYKTVPEQELHLSLKRRDAELIAEKNLYYRLLANKCTWMLYSAEILDPRITEKVTQANWDYNRVFPWMKRRHVLEKDQGIEWENKEREVRVLFSFQTFAYPVSSGMKVIDVTDKREIMPSKELIQVQPIHTYWVGKEPPKELFEVYRFNEPFTVQASLQPLTGKMAIRLIIKNNQSSEMKVFVKILIPEQAKWKFSKERDEVILTPKGKEERMYELIESPLLPQDLPLDLVLEAENYRQYLTMWMFKTHLDPVMMNKPVPYDYDDQGKQIFDPPEDFCFIFVPRYQGVKNELPY